MSIRGNKQCKSLKEACNRFFDIGLHLPKSKSRKEDKPQSPRHHTISPTYDQSLFFLGFPATAVTTTMAMARGGALLMMAYTGRLHPKGVPFSGFRYIKG